MNNEERVVSFSVLNQEFENFLTVLQKHKLEYNHIKYVIQEEQYIEVMIPDMRQAIAAMYDIFGEYGYMEIISYQPDEDVLEDQFVQFVSVNHMTHILEKAILIYPLGTVH